MLHTQAGAFGNSGQTLQRGLTVKPSEWLSAALTRPEQSWLRSVVLGFSLLEWSLCVCGRHKPEISRVLAKSQSNRMNVEAQKMAAMLCNGLIPSDGDSCLYLERSGLSCYLPHKAAGPRALVLEIQGQGFQRYVAQSLMTTCSPPSAHE